MMCAEVGWLPQVLPRWQAVDGYALRIGFKGLHVEGGSQGAKGERGKRHMSAACTSRASVLLCWVLCWESVAWSQVYIVRTAKCVSCVACLLQKHSLPMLLLLLLLFEGSCANSPNTHQQ